MPFLTGALGRARITCISSPQDKQSWLHHPSKFLLQSPNSTSSDQRESLQASTNLIMFNKVERQSACWETKQDIPPYLDWEEKDMEDGRKCSNFGSFHADSWLAQPLARTSKSQDEDLGGIIGNVFRLSLGPSITKADDLVSVQTCIGWWEGEEDSK